MKKLLVLASLFAASAALAQGVPIKSGSTTDLADGYPAYKTLVVTQRPMAANCYTVSAQTGTEAAAATAGLAFFAMRLNPGATVTAYISRVRFTFTTIVAFTTPVTAGRWLGLYRGSGAAASTGTAIAAAEPLISTASTSQFNSGNSGDMRVTTTGTLTTTGITFDTPPIWTYPLSSVGASGGFLDVDTVFDNQAHPIAIKAGELLALRVGTNAMDAAGTWQGTLNVEWCEK